MPHEVTKYQLDIVDSLDAIKLHTHGITQYSEFIANRTIYRAVERELEIIAEAINKMQKLKQDIQLTNAKRIIGLRNRVIHSYDHINYDIVWGVVVNHHDPLKTEVLELIKQHE